MDVSAWPAKTQDYLKIVFDLTERTGRPAGMGEIALRMGQRASTTTEGVKRLAEKGLVEHERYAGISLTDAGRAVAMVMVRRHRLLETYLVEQLGYRWDEIHEEADRLEHAVSDTFIARIDSLLGRPTRDPHGDPIPTAAGEIESLRVQSLSSLAEGASAVVERINDSDAELLRYLAEMGIRPGVDVTMTGTRFAGMRLVAAGTREVALADAALDAIDVSTAF
ncbi:Iron-dependent repressor IdeR [Corynebacterium capitovis DSM 44611]|uniref:metal-dependent transcriptional regulator n=1 Tax=Corynebacterium capitovis TaxID=131081 RepID=UPI00037A2289|nr:metal-dependent transcriptional regulator [Corynebacterium capitovis]WKD57132.1 Iron-dependent repressor IdeR [Corynebacterium capitovis DSM 44611]